MNCNLLHSHNLHYFLKLLDFFGIQMVAFGNVSCKIRKAIKISAGNCLYDSGGLSLVLVNKRRLLLIFLTNNRSPQGVLPLNMLYCWFNVGRIFERGVILLSAGLSIRISEHIICNIRNLLNINSEKRPHFHLSKTRRNERNEMSACGIYSKNLHLCKRGERNMRASYPTRGGSMYAPLEVSTDGVQWF